MRITYIGHATLLIEIDGRRILTDPNFDPALGRFLARVSEPGIALGELPKLDAILVTHAHADHLSFTSLDLLPRDIPLYAPPSVARWLTRLGYAHAVPLAPGETAQLHELAIHAELATHHGSRYGVDKWRKHANMYLLDTGVKSCFFAGDTALTEDTTSLVRTHCHEAGRRLDVALLPIGHAPWWKTGFRKGHLTSADALELFGRMDARYLIPYHWGTFDHVTSKAHDAINRLRLLLPEHPREGDVRIVEPGQTFELD